MTLVAAVALLVRVAAATVVVFPIPEDTAYYYGVARNLLEGRGLVSDALWSFQTPPLVFPRPAFEVWLPLPTFLAVMPMAIFGATYSVSQLVPVAFGTLIPVLAWRLAWDLATERGLDGGRRRTLAIGTGLTAAVELPLILHSTLLDSTALFAAIALAACILMARVVDRPRGGRLTDRRLLAIGALLGLAALTRNEAVWLALAWAAVAWFATRDRDSGGVRPSRAERLRLIAVPAVVAILIFAPWAVRNWIEFGNPLPGQAVANALSVTGFDIFAWSDPPTVSRHLAVGPARLLEMRVEGFLHNLLTVLLLPSFPIGLIGLLALPLVWRSRTLRPLLIVSALTFAVTTLAFPVATTWGTYLHAAGPAHVLLILTALVALDALLARVGRWRGWTKPVAWLAPGLTTVAALVFALAFVPAFGAQSQERADRYRVLGAQLQAIGRSPATMGPVISDFPIWLSEAERIPTLALPDEPPASILDLARAFPGTRHLLLSAEEHGRWPAVLDSADPDVACFREVPLGSPADAADAASLEGVRLFEIVCP
ncbi:MAG: hypothetical protein FJ038_01775 [Chloroflexi bacterium]|nr:hypothetical protein [Chloroflexota bacterium]